MPGKRPAKKGSFGTHLDELVKHFLHEHPQPRTKPEDGEQLTPGNIHDRLFESSWRQAREAHEARFPFEFATWRVDGDRGGWKGHH